MEQVIGGGDNSRPPSCTEKVAFSIFRYFPYGGLQLDMMRMAREFTARGIQVDIYCMGYDAPEIPDGVTFKVLKTSGLSNHRKARNFEKQLAEALKDEDYLAHIAFNRLTPADWYFAADMPFVESVKRSFWEKLMPRYRTFAAMEKELVLENMVKSLGFSDAVVSVSSDSDNVNVFINASELNYDTALSIYNMMKNETGVVAGNIIIMPVYAES